MRVSLLVSSTLLRTLEDYVGIKSSLLSAYSQWGNGYLLVPDDVHTCESKKIKTPQITLTVTLTPLAVY